MGTPVTESPRSILAVARALGLNERDLQFYGDDVAKLDPRALAARPPRSEAAKLILVSAITPTPAGEGKTTTSIGLSDAMWKLGHSSCLALREPSLGPVFGMKGGATGGGRSQLVPQDRINLHFTGDFHAVTSAHNLLAALLDNHIYFGNELGIDPRRVLWRRVMDMNDRALRHTIVGLGGHREGVPRETGFDITAASEVMATLCLAEGEDDLRARLERILVAFSYSGEPITADRLNASGAMLALLRDALRPNLVQTLEGTPALLHGGPFANIAHGCSSVVATRMALQLADYAITEAGFGFDLGAEKFFDIKCRSADLDTAAVVLVATVRALQQHGGADRQRVGRNPAAVAAGLPNLEKHIENIRHFGETPVVALNRFADDTDEEIAIVRERCAELGVAFAVTDHFARGGEGATELAALVIDRAERRAKPFEPLYRLEDSVETKVLTVAQKMYGARDVVFTAQAKRDLADVERLGHAGLPICIAKTPASLSDDPRLGGRPTGFGITVRGLRINAGAGFLVVLTGDVVRMPGLPRHPRSEHIDLHDGEITGLS